MELYLMQHGEALSKEVDPERSLSPEGQRQVETAGRALGFMGVELGCIITSTKKRAQQTAGAVARALGLPEGRIHVVEALDPLVPPEEAIESVVRFDEGRPILLAGHLPSLAELAAYLMDCQRRIAFRMGGVGCLAVEKWERGSGSLLWYLTPEQLSLMAQEGA
jgi:phosphohistidine phosphatase